MRIVEDPTLFRDTIRTTLNTKIKSDATTLIIENGIYNSSNVLFDKFSYSYDDKGNIIEESDHNADGVVFRKNSYKYQYDSNNNWTKRVKYKY